MDEHNITTARYLLQRRDPRWNVHCSCGEFAAGLTTAGMVSAWTTDHINRFPTETSRLVTACAHAVAASERGSSLLARGWLNVAIGIGSRLQSLVGTEPRDAEHLALDILAFSKLWVLESAAVAREWARANQLPEQYADADT